jgi:hypothetical protein
MLATEILWAFENSRKESVLHNRQFIEENADYKINMKIIANRYHELIDSVQND